MSTTFTCDLCGKVGDCRPEAEANAEALAVWGVENASERDDMAVVCGTCWAMIHPAKYPERRDECLCKLDTPT